MANTSNTNSACSSSNSPAFTISNEYNGSLFSLPQFVGEDGVDIMNNTWMPNHALLFPGCMPSSFMTSTTHVSPEERRQRILHVIEECLKIVHEIDGTEAEADDGRTEDVIVSRTASPNQ